MIITRSVALLFAYAAINGFLGVALSAWASHGLINVVPTGEQGVRWFEQGSTFQFGHAMAIILVTLAHMHMAEGLGRKLMLAAALLLSASIVFFSGSLYAVAFNGFGMLAPLGGLSSMIGWLLFGAGALTTLRKNESAGVAGVRPHPAE